MYLILSYQIRSIIMDAPDQDQLNANRLACLMRGCLSPSGGWVRIRIIRCTNLFPFTAAAKNSCFAKFYCVLSAEGLPGIHRQTSEAECDSLGNVHWEQEFLFPLFSSTCLIRIQLWRIHLHRPAVLHGIWTITLADQMDQVKWCRIDSTVEPCSKDPTHDNEVNGHIRCKDISGEAGGELLVRTSRRFLLHDDCCIPEDPLQACSEYPGRTRNIDRHGFAIHVTMKDIDEFEQYQQLRLSVQQKMWLKSPLHLQLSTGVLTMADIGYKPGFVHETQHKRIGWQPRDKVTRHGCNLALGLPQAARIPVWLYLSGAEDLASAVSPSYFANLSDQARQVMTSIQSHGKNKRRWDENDLIKVAAHQILLDVGRTFPEHIFFCDHSNLRLLECILLAHALRNPRLGYTQSLNFICGFLLVQCASAQIYWRCHVAPGQPPKNRLIPPDELTFWMLCVITEKILPDYFTSQMTGVRVDNLILLRLIDEHSTLHKMISIFEGAGFEMSLVSTQVKAVWPCSKHMVRFCLFD